jgi:glutamine phosphoribosylpyrophosphate amidotransferase
LHNTLEYLMLDGMLDAAGRRNEWCHASYSGDYAAAVQLSPGSLRRYPPLVTATV